MTKKKRNEEQSADFINNPFKSLTDYAARTVQTPARPRPARKQAEQSGDENELFLRAAAGARKLHDDGPGPRQAAEPAGKEAAPAAAERNAFLQAMRKMGAVVKSGERNDEDFPEPAGRSRSSRMKQLKRGGLRISRELDLHGYVRDEALTRLERFITGAFDRGQDAVLVITGKGNNSPEGPVLQGAVAEWLSRQGKDMVAEFAFAPRDKGGSGAFVVFLKRK